MVKNQPKQSQSVIYATVVAGLVMLTTGIGYRALKGHLAAPVDAATLTPEELERLPLDIGDWTGRESPLDEAVVEATDTDAHISRSYLRKNHTESVWLYIAYGVRVRDLMPHRPEVCYTGAGWTLIDRRFMELLLDNGMKLPCNVLQFSRGSLNKQRIIVLDYYIVDGQYCHDVSLLRKKAWRGSGTVEQVVQVQVVASVAPNLPVNSAGRAVTSFATESALSISSLFEAAGENLHPDKGHLDANNISVED